MAKQNDEQPQLNREQRRQAKFGRHRTVTHDPWPSSTPNPAVGLSADPDAPAEAVAGESDQDQTAATGPGTGGATEQAGRAPRHQGTHAGNSTKG